MVAARAVGDDIPGPAVLTLWTPGTYNLKSPDGITVSVNLPERRHPEDTHVVPQGWVISVMYVNNFLSGYKPA